MKLRKALVAAQISLSLLLLIGAGLFARSLYNLMQVNSGMRTEHVLSFSVDPSLAGYSDERARQLFGRLQEALRAAPGAQAVSGSENPILANDNWMSTTRAEGYTAKEGENLNPDVNGCCPRSSQRWGSRWSPAGNLRSGWLWRAQSRNRERELRQVFRDRNPMGRHIGFGSPQSAKLDMEIVGVVKDVKAVDLKRKPSRQVWIPALQEEHPSGLTFYVRTENDPQGIARLARRTVHRIDAALPVHDMKTVETQIRETHYIDRLITMLSAAFGLLATLLAAVGLYGVMAFTVARRTRELGIRMALGAQRGSVVRLVMQELFSARRNRDWCCPAPRVRTGPLHREPIVWAESDGSFDSDSCNFTSRDSCARGGIHTRAPSHTHRSRGCAALGIEAPVFVKAFWHTDN